MIATQTAALFLDAYRELNAKKLFWITLVLSGLVVAVFGAIGIDDRGITFLFWRLGWLPLNTSVISRETFYTLTFSNLGIGIWLSWIATILALVSTAGIIPDHVSGGSIETVLSKPISRLRLLLTKLATGLLFVALQVLVFTLGSFLVFGLRAGVWNFGLFLAVPIVVLFYSYLFAVCALLGMLTRSTVAALLLTMLLWACLFVVNLADGGMLMFSERQQMIVEKREQRIELMEANTAIILQRQHDAEDQSPDPASEPAWSPSDAELLAHNPFLADQRDKLAANRRTLAELRFWTGVVVAIKTVLPKTAETIDLLERHLVDLDDLPAPDADREPLAPEDPAEDVEIDQDQLNQRLAERLRDRSVWWIVGTSLLFEAAVVALTALIFTRRDF